MQNGATQATAWIGNLPLNRRHALIYALCSGALILDAVDIQVMALLAPAIGKGWGMATGLSTAVFALTATGMFVGAAVSGRLADRLGRKPILLAALALFSLATLACALAPSPAYLLASRLAAGVGLGAFISVNTAYLVEFLPDRHRGPLMGVWTIGLPLGNLVATGIASLMLAEAGWRAIFIVCAAAAIPLLAGLARIPESPVYLARKGRSEAAMKAARWLAGTSPPPFTPPHETGTSRMRDLFDGPRGRHTMLIWTIWFTWNFAYFGAVLWMPTIIAAALPQLSPFLAVASLATAGIAGRVVAAAMLNRAGRRHTLILCACGASAAAAALGIGDSPLAWLLGIAALGFFLDGGAAAIVTWTPEMHPTHLRATAVGFANAAGRAGAIAAPLVVGLLVSTSPKTAFFAFGAVLVLAIVAAILLRAETREQQLDAGDI